MLISIARSRPISMLMLGGAPAKTGSAGAVGGTRKGAGEMDTYAAPGAAGASGDGDDGNEAAEGGRPGAHAMAGDSMSPPSAAKRNSGRKASDTKLELQLMLGGCCMQLLPQYREIGAAAMVDLRLD